MPSALTTAATGMEAQQTIVDVIANNLANVNTTGFKKSRVDFQDLLYQDARNVGSAVTADNDVPTGTQVGSGVRTAAVYKIYTMGSIGAGARGELDVAIEGDGFFQISLPDGTTAYTRAGAFKKDGDGQIVTSDGYPLEPGMVVPENTTDISIGADGTVEAIIDGDTANPNELGTIELVRFSNPAGLKSIGNNLHKETTTSGAPIAGIPSEDGMGALRQKALEDSNVSTMQEMTNMISAQRAYEINSKAIKTTDEMLQMTNQLA
ncbi:MAG: flagellar basal-body rod protein FlgG [Thermodesulfobacteriota bacterium]